MAKIFAHWYSLIYLFKLPPKSRSFKSLQDVIEGYINIIARDVKSTVKKACFTAHFQAHPEKSTCCWLAARVVTGSGPYTGRGMRSAVGIFFKQEFLLTSDIGCSSD
jgi:hypothetical protein